MTLELSDMKIITVLAMIYEVFCMMGDKWKEKSCYNCDSSENNGCYVY